MIFPLNNQAKTYPKDIVGLIISSAWIDSLIFTLKKREISLRCLWWSNIVPLPPQTDGVSIAAIKQIKSAASEFLFWHNWNNQLNDHYYFDNILWVNQFGNFPSEQPDKDLPKRYCRINTLDSWSVIHAKKASLIWSHTLNKKISYLVFINTSKSSEEYFNLFSLEKKISKIGFFENIRRATGLSLSIKIFRGW